MVDSPSTQHKTHSALADSTPCEAVRRKECCRRGSPRYTGAVYKAPGWLHVGYHPGGTDDTTGPSCSTSPKRTSGSAPSHSIGAVPSTGDIILLSSNVSTSLTAWTETLLHWSVRGVVFVLIVAGMDHPVLQEDRFVLVFN